MRYRAGWVCALVLVITAGCGGTGEVDTGGATETEGATGAGETSDEAIPGNVTLEPVDQKSPVTGTARFASEGSDEVAITTTLDDLKAKDLIGGQFATLVLPGTCAEQSEPADFDGALDQTAVTPGAEAENPLVVPLTDILDSPHSVMTTTLTGEASLACGDIVAP